MTRRTVSNDVLRHLTLGLVLTGALAHGAHAQCERWKPGFDYNGTDDVVRCFATFDDGTGQALYASGSFTQAGVASASHIAKWDGERWSALTPLGLPNYGNAMLVFDDGSGPALYVGGVWGGPPYARIVRWDGTSISHLNSSMNNAVFALASYDDGSGPALIAGGLFTTTNGVNSVNRIAKWNGTSWSTLGSGMQDGGVYALAVLDDGSGAKLYAGGTFTSAGGNAASRVAVWNGSAWSELGGGTDNDVFAMAVHDDGSGAALYLGGSFIVAGGQSANAIARWNGSAWSSLGTGANQKIVSLAVHDEGSGPALFAGGDFTSVGGIPAQRVARWNGSDWTALGAGRNDTVLALGAFDDGSTRALFVGGTFRNNQYTGGPEYVVKWEDSDWRGVGEGISASGLAGTRSFQEFDDGSGPALYVGGDWNYAVGAEHARHIARWNGSRWSALPDDFIDGVFAMSVFDDGGGPALFAGGGLLLGGPMAAHVLRWNGTSWTRPGGAVLGDVYAMAQFDDGSGTALYVAGDDLGPIVAGENSVQMAKWNGTSWTYMTISTPFADVTVRALAVFDDGSGPALYAGGRFSALGGVNAKSIAKWNGTSWETLGTGLTEVGGALSYALALAVFDDGAGPALYAGGTFDVAGGVGAVGIARWDGAAWSSVGGGTNGSLSALRVFDDGSGNKLYAGGSFTTVGALNANNVARWDGADWSTLTTGTDAKVSAFGAFDDGDGADLYVGGAFTLAGGVASSRIAAWEGCGPGVPYCFGDGVDSVVTADCPCGNFGDSGHGCGNSFSAAGALLEATGTTNPNTIVFTATNLPNNNLTVGFRNTDNATPGGAVFGDGVRCQSGTLIRFGAHNSGSAGDPANTWSSTTSTVAAGQTRYYQVQYRNPAPAFCPPASFNITNGFRIVW